MLLLAADKVGTIEYDAEQNFLEELAFEIDEAAEKTAACVTFLQENKLLLPKNYNEYFLPAIKSMTGTGDMKPKKGRSGNDSSFPTMDVSESDIPF